MDKKHIQHLYNRVGFGISATKIAELASQSKEAIVHNIFSESKKITPLTFSFSTKSEMNKKAKAKSKKTLYKEKVKDFNALWLQRLGNTNELLREKMTLFWANVFVCKSKNALHTEQYNNTLRTHALGNFKDFVKQISKEPAMLTYLNGNQNVKKEPNENFARELMELFTLGQGNYTENDIKESARAFTGYNFNVDGEFVLRENMHDVGKKEFFGQSGNFTGDDIIDMIVKKKQCATFICQKIYRYFVNETLNENHVNQLTAIFYKDYDIENLMRYLLLSDWFYDNKNIGTKIKSPIELLVGINMVVPYTIKSVQQSFILQRVMGQALLYPSDVSGWKEGKSWIDSSTLITRVRLASVLLNNGQIIYSDKGELDDEVSNFDTEKMHKKMAIKTNVNWEIFEENFKNMSNDALLNHLIIAPINKGTQALLKTTSNIPKKEYCIQIMSLPEYQLC